MALKPSIRGLTSHVGVCDTTLNESCSEEHINVISQDLPWRLVAPYLDLTATDIDDIDHGGEESEKRRKALLRWKEKQAYLATYKKLIEALLAIGYATTAERVCNLLKGKAKIADPQPFYSIKKQEYQATYMKLFVDRLCVERSKVVF